MAASATHLRHGAARGESGRSSRRTCAAEAKEKSTPLASSATSSLPDGSLRTTTWSEGSLSRPLIGIDVQHVEWDRVWLGARLRPHARHSHCGDDIYLLGCFLQLAELPDVHDAAVDLLFRTLKFLHLCSYTAEDICSILAHASAYFNDTWRRCGGQMDSLEVGNVLATLTFIAHCYVQDEACPLRVWHKHLFCRYCSLQTMNCAVMQLLKIRRHVLRLSSEELGRRYDRLTGVLQRTRLQSYADSCTEANAW